MRQIIDRPSPNQNDRPVGARPRLIVIHGTVGTDQGDLSHILSAESQVSYHYLIQRDGTIIRLVRPHRRAWHAGKSSWRGVADVNDFSIGIGLSNLGPGREEQFTEEQYASCGWLVSELQEDFQIPPSELTGHSVISPGRKTDPWDYFDWPKLGAYIKTEGEPLPITMHHPEASVTVGPIRAVDPAADDLRGLRLDRIEVPTPEHVRAIVDRDEPMRPEYVSIGLGIAATFLRGVLAGGKADLPAAARALEEYLRER